MGNSYTWPGVGERWTVGQATTIGRLNTARIGMDHLHEALNHIMDTDNPEGGLSFSAAGDITMAEDGWVGLGAAAGRIVFDSTPAPDVVSIMSADVGIGTASPAGPFHITTTGQSILHFAGDRGNAPNLPIVDFTFTNDNSAGSAYNPALISARTGTGNTNGELLFQTHNGTALQDVMLIDESGNVGIGTASPAGPFHITTAGQSILHFAGDRGNAPNLPIVDFTFTNDNSAGSAYNPALISARTGTGNTNGELLFQTHNGTALQDVMLIDESGNVGIGTASPDERFHVATTGATAINFEGQRGDAADLPIVEIIFENSLATLDAAKISALTGSGNANGALQLQTHNGSALTTALHIDESQNVTVSGDINPEADGTRDLGTQTTAQWANVWSDLINGADISIANKWRMLESELYEGYPVGWAVGHGDAWEDGVSLYKNPETMGEAQPTFVVTDDFLEYKGRRFTPEMMDALIEVAA